MIPRPQLLQLGLLLPLVGLALFVIYIVNSPVLAILLLAVFSGGGVFLLRRAAPSD